MGTRTRNHQVKFRLDDYEYGVFKKNYDDSGCASISDFIFEMCRQGYILNVNFDGLKSVSYELNAIGNNINQIAHKANAEGYNSIEVTELANAVRSLQKIVAFAFHKY